MHTCTAIAVLSINHGQLFHFRQAGVGLKIRGRTSLLVVFVVILWHNGGFSIRVDWLIPG